MIVKHFNVLKYYWFSFISCVVDSVFNLLPLQVAKKSLGHYIVIAVATSTHTGDQVVLFPPATKLITTKLTALVWMNHHRWFRLSWPFGHHQGRLRFAYWPSLTIPPLLNVNTKLYRTPDSTSLHKFWFAKYLSPTPHRGDWLQAVVASGWD